MNKNLTVGKLYELVFEPNIKREVVKSISDNALEVMKLRYFIDIPDGKESDYHHICRRVSRVIAASETLYTYDLNWIKSIETHIYNDMASHRFLFNSPALFSAGVGLSKDVMLSQLIYKDDAEINDYLDIVKNRNKNQMMFACFTLGVPDSIEGIFDSVKNAAIISKYGGGVGANFGKLRERDSLIAGGCGGKASGPISFMQTWNTMGSVVVQGGKRRAALMGMLNSNHPDIEEFIDSKTKDGNLSYFNISVAIDDKFMSAVINNDSYDLISPGSGEIVKSIAARDLWDKICTSAHAKGDPGIFFIDTANKDNLLHLDDDYYIETTNPCGEQPLPNETSCNLGSINLDAFVDENGNFDMVDFEDQIIRAMYYLDLVIDTTTYPLKIIEQRTKEIRPVGLGIMGLADACIRMGIEYGSKEFLEFCDKIGKSLAKESLFASAAMADLKGAFKDWTVVDGLFQLTLDSKYSKLYTFNSNDVTEQCDIDSAFEEGKQIVKNLEDSGDIPKSFTSAIKNIFESANENHGKFSAISLLSSIMVGAGLRNSRRLSIAPTGTISLLLNTSSSIEPNFAYSWTRSVVVGPDDRKQLEYKHRYFNYPENLKISAHDLTPMQHAKVVAIFAPYIDSAISKTVNMPENATVQDVKDVYSYCYGMGIKGITIYRDRSRDEQPIIKEEKKDNEVMKEINKLEVPIDNPIKPNLESTVRERPKVMHGVTTKSDSPYGSIYVTANFDENGKMFETFISAGKSGSVSKSVTEAFSRVISLALRSGVNIDDIIKTISNISGSEVWVYDTLDGKELVVKSIPDVSGKMLLDLNVYYKSLIAGKPTTVQQDVPVKETEFVTKMENDSFGHVRSECPECHSKMIPAAGCATCMACGYSDCK